jgi:mono/diheme cytochrome c family protein
MRMKLCLATIGAAAMVATTLSAPTSRADDKKIDFVTDVQPILAQSCVKCHGADPKGRKPKGKLDLTTKDAAMKGGENKDDIVAGKSGDSMVYKLLLGPVGSGDDEIGRMPYKKDKLSDDKIAIIKAWIDQGANWPDDAKVKLQP